MLRGFRHTLFLMLQAAVLFSGGIALVLRPDAWQPIAICVAGAVLASLVCERIASRYLRNTLGRLRRAGGDLGRGGGGTAGNEGQARGDLFKLVSPLNLVAPRP
ncbi:MAG TPA: hypothetical protein PKC49_04935, partial [Phycisphaerae bacterium]|nr:hypothetical protein [Phycisphaerae bacterium]